MTATPPVRPSSHYRTVVNAILALPREYHTPLFCRYIEDAPYLEIAARTGNRPEVVAQLLYHGTLMLNAELAHLINPAS